MTMRRLLDLFCGAGGAAVGYHRAGFDVVGVDIKRQRHYPFEFIQADALAFMDEGGWRGFDAIHASPPCQAYSRTRKMHLDKPDGFYADLIAPTRERLAASGVPWVLENVPGSPIRGSLLLCGSMFGLRVQRHRYFEVSWAMPAMAPFSHDHRGIWLNMYTSGERRRGTDREYVDALGVTWATTREGRQAIPPAYTEWIGAQLLRAIEAAA